MLSRMSLICAIALGFSGCATNEIDPSTLPAEAFVDDGVDYYSSVDLTTVPSSGANQWRLDENGEKIYTLSRALVDDTSIYYVGDVRFLLHERNSSYGIDRNPVSNYGVNTPVEYNARPIYAPNVRDPLLRRPRSPGIRYRTSDSTGSASSSSGATSQPPATAPPPRAPRTAPAPRIQSEPRPSTQRPTRTSSPTRDNKR